MPTTVHRSKAKAMAACEAAGFTMVVFGRGESQHLARPDAPRDGQGSPLETAHVWLEGRDWKLSLPDSEEGKAL